MSGLIWAGIGKGIADAGNTFGNAMFKAIDADVAEQRLLDREERRAKLKEEADERKLERDAQERVDIASRASKRADEMATARVEAPLAKDAAALAKSSARAGEDGDVALSEDQLKDLIRNDPKLRESYKKSGIIGGAIESAVDPRLQRANDEEQAVRELGGKASVVEAYAKAKKDVLAQIAQENKDKAAERRADNESRKTDALIERMDSRNKTDQQNADSNRIRAERPPSSGSGGGAGGAKVRSTYTDDQGNKVAVMSDGSTKVLGRGMDFDKQVANLVNTMSKNDYQFGKLPEEEKRQKAIERLTGGMPAPKTGDNADTRPPLSAFKR